MSESFTITIDDAEARGLLEQAIARLNDLTPAMRKISELLIEASRRAFDDTRADPETGAPWVPLAPSTLKSRARRGRSALNILQDSGLLKSSIGRTGGQGILKVGPFEAIVGTSVPYAAVHQLGATINGAGKNGPYSFSIPARPFLGAGSRDLEKIKSIIRNAVPGANNG